MRSARAACVVSAMVLLQWIGPGGRQLAAQTVERVDYLTFAHGAVPVSVGGAAAAARRELRARAAHHRRQRAGVCADEQAGRRRSRHGLRLQPPGADDVRPLCRAGCARDAEPDADVHPRSWKCSDPRRGHDSGYELLASATLQAHKTRGLVTELTVARKTPVSWVKVRLSGGINTTPAPTFLEFSEIIGNGVQEAARLVDHFTGAWRGTGVEIELKQDGAVVAGCYDINGRLNGTVSGNILRATGVNTSRQGAQRVRPERRSRRHAARRCIHQPGAIPHVHRRTRGGRARAVCQPAGPGAWLRIGDSGHHVRLRFGVDSSRFGAGTGAVVRRACAPTRAQASPSRVTRPAKANPSTTSSSPNAARRPSSPISRVAASIAGV